MDSRTQSQTVHQASLETYYRRTYGDQLAVRLASIVLLSGVTVYLGVWPLVWAIIWSLGYLGGELAVPGPLKLPVPAVARSQSEPDLQPARSPLPPNTKLRQIVGQLLAE